MEIKSFFSAKHANLSAMLCFFVFICIAVVSPQRGRGQIDDDLTNQRGTLDAARLQQRLLSSGRAKWTSINNAHYQYQLQRSCFCSVCDIQAMNVYVEDDTVSNVEYAEGNEYALNSFCFGNELAYNRRLIASQMTIDDLFDFIQASITNNENIAVLYHDDLGIPLSISLDLSDAIDDEIFFSINCMQFDTDFPSPIASTPQPTRRGRRGRNNRNQQQVVATTTMEEFNSNDPYSCLNINVPSECSNGYFTCNRYSDGCNTCSCDESGNVISCTKRRCEEDTSSDAQCIDCQSNTEWTECANHPQCIPDCFSPDNFCGFGAPPGCNEARCECPPSRPRWDGQECVTAIECGLDETESTEGDALITFCVPHCGRYTDGCVTCDCNRDGFVDNNCLQDLTAIDGAGGCFPGSFSNRRCLECADPERMVYTQCGGSDKTCQNIGTFEPITQCIEKCECIPEFPIFDAVIGRCVSASVCADTTPPFVDVGNCVHHCPVYFNGCNACQCPDIVGESSDDDGTDFCTNLQNCPPNAEGGPTRTCFRCELPIMEYTKCGKCDRTCLDPSPSCVNDDECIEKCECPLDRPIYHEGSCITLEECPVSTSSSGFGLSGGFGSDSDSNDDAQKQSNAQQPVIESNDANQRKVIRWEEHGLYVIIAVICTVAGIVLMLWPCCINRVRRKSEAIKMSKLDNESNDEEDEESKVRSANDADLEEEEIGDMVQLPYIEEEDDDTDNGLRFGPDGSMQMSDEHDLVVTHVADSTGLLP